MVYSIFSLDFFHFWGQEKKVKAAIEAANYCEIDSDCVQLQSRCPFDCYVHVNKNEAGRIMAMIDDFKSTCVYGCVAPPDFPCIEGKCRPDLSRLE
jgi:hypothetical protein